MVTCSALKVARHSDVCEFLLPPTVSLTAQNSLSLSDWVALVNLLVAVVALVVAGGAAHIALRTMKDAEGDWKQRKWYDLYFTAGLAHDVLDHFRRTYTQPHSVTPNFMRDWNDLMLRVRECHTMAAVFPRCSVIDGLFEATDFSTVAFAYDDARFEKLGVAVENLRQKALLNPSVLARK